MPDVFVSYTRHDLEFVARLAKILEAQGLSVWYDASLRGGAEWRASIVGAIQSARVVLLAYSRATEKSAEVAKELAVAANQKQRIIPIRIEDAVPSGAFLYEMARLNWVDCFPVTPARLETVAIAVGELVRAGADAPAVESFDRAVGARYLGESSIARLSRSSLALALAIFAISVSLFGAYEQVTSFLHEQAQAGVPPLDSIREGALIVTLGAPLVLLQSLSHLDQPWSWAIVPLAAANCALLLLAARNAINWVRRRIAFAWATKRPTGANP